ncbi:MAG TPA: COX15/CtaA family protein, partial [Tepidisphaeraceae bacterium]|nr:COX15/CtaA family protein [Tepidisphaeraceae bacterium]
MSAQRYNRVLHHIALLTACATFPLIFMGGLVTSKQAGMSVPDWPNSYGYNMFLFPPRLWIGNIFYEHTHRLMGTVVGMLSILLTIVAWKTEPRRWVRWLATAVLGAVIFQGVLGGLRVVLVKLDLAIVHACFAQAFFCLTAFTALVTSQWWLETVREGEAPSEPFRSTLERRLGRSLPLPNEPPPGGPEGGERGETEEGL